MMSALSNNSTQRIKKVLLKGNGSVDQKGISSSLKILISFHCGHGVLPKMSKLVLELKDICEHNIDQMFVLNSVQEPTKEMRDYGQVRTFSTEKLGLTSGYPDTDTRRRIALEYGKLHNYDRVVLMDDNIVMPIEQFLHLIMKTPKGGVVGCVEKNSNRQANKDNSYRERHPNFPSALYPNSNTWTHQTLIDQDEPILCKPEQNPMCIPLGIGGCYKIQCLDTKYLSIEKLRKMFPHNGFEPWQDMWMMVWAWFLFIPVKILHNVYYERVIYKHESSNHRVKGRCKQTMGEYQKRIFKHTESWPEHLLFHGLGYIQHRGNHHYLEWDIREKFEFELHNILTYNGFVPAMYQTSMVLKTRFTLQDYSYDFSQAIKYAYKHLPPKTHKAFNDLCKRFPMHQVAIPEHEYWGRKHGLTKKQYNHPDFIKESQQISEQHRFSHGYKKIP